MLFNYKALSDHSIYKLQEWVDQIFLDVWCQADSSVDYSIELLPEEVKEVVLEIYNNDSITTDYLYGPIEKVYRIFQGISFDARQKLKQLYLDTSTVDKLCCNKPDCVPFRSSDFLDEYLFLKEPLEKFFNSLWKSVLNLSVVRGKIGSVYEHYNEFVKINSKGICPFCGLNNIDSPYVETREPYDHYLPKSIYPFLSVNFNNLAPMCHKCNSGNKTTKDPIFDGTARRKAFYIYDSNSKDVEIKIYIDKTELNGLIPEDITIEFGPNEIAEELKTWDDLFDIENRYKAKCCEENCGKYWITQVMDECYNYNLTPQKFLQGKLKESEKNPFNEMNFLRKPFLEACDEKHIFD